MARPDVKFDTDYSALNRYVVDHKGSEVALIGLGNYWQLAEQVAGLLKEKGIDPTIINPRYITGVDEKLMEELRDGHKLVVTLENGVIAGGFGEKIAAYYGPSSMRVLCKGLRKEFYDRVPYPELAFRNRLTPELIVEDILAALK